MDAQGGSCASFLSLSLSLSPVLCLFLPHFVLRRFIGAKARCCTQATCFSHGLCAVTPSCILHSALYIPPAIYFFSSRYVSERVMESTDTTRGITKSASGQLQNKNRHRHRQSKLTCSSSTISAAVSLHCDFNSFVTSTAQKVFAIFYDLRIINRDEVGRDAINENWPLPALTLPSHVLLMCGTINSPSCTNQAVEWLPRRWMTPPTLNDRIKRALLINSTRRWYRRCRSHIRFLRRREICWDSWMVRFSCLSSLFRLEKTFSGAPSCTKNSRWLMSPDD